jgi:HK97 family phage portal protein
MLLSALAHAFDRRSWTVAGGHPRDPAIANMLGLGATTKAGILVNEKTAVTFSAVFRATNLRGMAMGYLPLAPFLRKPDNSREILTEHPLYRLLHDTVNEDLQISAFSFRQWCESKVCLWGNAYAWIERRRNGTPVALWPHHPSRVTPDLKRDSTLVYVFHGDRERDKTYRPDEVIHQKGVGDDPLVGWSRIRQARESLGQAMAAQQFGAAWFGQGARMGAILTTLPGFRKEDAKLLMESVAKQTVGEDNWHRAVVMPGVDKVTPVTVPAEDAQFLGTQEHGVADVGRWFDVPLAFLMLPNSEPRANVEQDSLNFVVWTIGPQCRNYEQEYNQKLLQPSERSSMFVEHNMDALLRGDFKARMEAYHFALGDGMVSRDDIARRENWNPIGEEAGGDVRTVPVNSMNLKALIGQTMPPAAVTPSAKIGEAPARAFDLEPLFTDACDRLLAKERKAVEAIMGKSRSHSDMDADIRAYYAGHDDAVQFVLLPTIRAFGGADGEAMARLIATRYCLRAVSTPWPEWSKGGARKFLRGEFRAAADIFKESVNVNEN